MSAPSLAPLSRGGQFTNIPARLDRLPWSRFHWAVVVGLGFVWILDGLSVQIVASAGYQKELDLSSTQVGALGIAYLVGQVVGALLFGWLSDRYRRLGAVDGFLVLRRVPSRRRHGHRR